MSSSSSPSDLLLAALHPPEGMAEAEYSAYLAALLGSVGQEASKTPNGGWVCLRKDEGGKVADPSKGAGIELDWVDDSSYRPRKRKGYVKQRDTNDPKRTRYVPRSRSRPPKPLRAQSGLERDARIPKLQHIPQESGNKHGLWKDRYRAEFSAAGEAFVFDVGQDWGGVWTVTFKRRQAQGGLIYKQSALPEKSAGLAVIKAVAAIFYRFLVDHDPEKFQFAASKDEPSRIRLYDFLAKRLEAWGHYRLERHGDKKDIIYTFTRIPRSATQQKELGWVDSGPSPQGGKKRIWRGTPPDKGTRHQIRMPGTGRGKRATNRDRNRSSTRGKGKVLYSGVVLDEVSRQGLLAALANRIPAGWKIVAHHMTTAFGKPLAQGLAGQKGNLTATHVGYDPQLGVLAVRVESDIPSENATPHVTIAVAPHGKPANANKITNWEPLPQPIPLSGTAQDVHAEGEKPTSRPSRTPASNLARYAASARQEAVRLRAAGDENRALHLERLADEWEDTATPRSQPAAPASRGVADPQTARPRYKVSDETPHGASLRMNSFLLAYMDQEVLKRYLPPGADPLHGIGIAAGGKTVFPIEGKFYVVDFGKDGGRHTQTLREVNPSQVKFRKARRQSG